jgi:hypothetical protein
MDDAVIVAGRGRDSDSRRLTAAGMRDECTPSAISRRLSQAILAILGIMSVALLWWFDPAEINVPLCSFHAWTGLECPGCGATRATHELLHGRLLMALRCNALWVLSLPLVAYLAISELRIMAGHRPLPGDLPRQTRFWLAVAAVAMVFFVLRNLPWAPFQLLCPPAFF